MSGLGDKVRADLCSFLEMSGSFLGEIRATSLKQSADLLLLSKTLESMPFLTLGFLSRDDKKFEPLASAKCVCIYICREVCGSWTVRIGDRI